MYIYNLMITEDDCEFVNYLGWLSFNKFVLHSIPIKIIEMCM